MIIARLLIMLCLAVAAGIVAAPVAPAFASSKTPHAGGPGSDWFLTAREFNRLTKREKKEYLKAVRKILATLSERSEMFAGAVNPQKKVASTPKNRDVASDEETESEADADAETQMQSATTPRQVELLLQQAEQWRGEVPKDFRQYQDKNNQDTYRTNFNQSLWWLVAARLKLNSLDPNDGQRKALEERTTKLENFYVKQRSLYESSFDKAKKLSPGYDALARAKKGETALSEETFPEGSMVLFGTGTSLRTAADQREYAQQLERQKREAELKAALEKKAEQMRQDIAAGRLTPDGRPVVQQTPQPAQTTTTTTTTTTANPDDATLIPERPVLGGYRCMYSGFIIEKDPCKGPSELPGNIRLPSLDSSQFKCDDSQVMCNPLLFGVKKSCALKVDMAEGEAKRCLLDSKPLCIRKSKSATADCTKESSSDEALESAATLIQFNPDAWTKYLTGFYELCDDMMIDFNSFADVRDGKPRIDPEAARAEISDTCKSAKVRLKELADKFRSVDVNRPSSRAAPKGDRLKPTNPTPTQGHQ